MERIDEAEEHVPPEAHHRAVLQHRRLADAPIVTDVRLGVGVAGRDGDDAVEVRDDAVLRVDVWRAQLEEAGPERLGLVAAHRRDVLRQLLNQRLLQLAAVCKRQQQTVRVSDVSATNT